MLWATLPNLVQIGGLISGEIGGGNTHGTGDLEVISFKKTMGVDIKTIYSGREIV